MDRSSEQQSKKNNNKEWTWMEEQAYEAGLETYPVGVEGRWEKVASLLPGRSPTEVKERYEALDVAIAALYHVDHKFPGYSCNVALMAPTTTESDDSAEIKAPQLNKNENKKVTYWTEEEHRLFLKGMEEYGKGDWRSISRYVVRSKTSTQVASHAQKYFLRQIDATKKRKRTSIHDINLGDENSNPQINNPTPPPPPNISRLQQIQMRIVKEFEQAREKFWQNFQNTPKQ